MVNTRNLIALFPHVFSRRGTSDDDLSARNWFNLDLALRRVRVMGPHWSFVFLVESSSDAARGTVMDVLQTRADPEDLPGGPKTYRQPTMLQLGIESVWQDPDQTAWDNPKSRLSMLATRTLVDANTLHLPLGDQRIAAPLDKRRTTALVTRAFGVHPKNEDFGNNTNKDDGQIYLPATQLVAGEAWINPDPDFLTKLRSEMQLEPPEVGFEASDRIVLLPDGFAFAASTTLPWMDTQLSAWFKLTNLSGADAARPVLRLWIPPGRQLDPGWQTALARLTQIIGNGDDTSAAAAHWLDVTTDRRLKPEALFWRCETASEVLAYRTEQAQNSVEIDRGLIARFSDGPGSVLALQPDGFAVSTNGPGSLTISVRARGQQSPALHYSYDRGTREQFKLAGGDGSAALDLAVPLLSTSERLRRAMGFEDPDQRADDLNGGKLWLYTPLETGWLHWPFPNVTNRILGNLITGTDSNDPAPTLESVAADEILAEPQERISAPAARITAGLLRLEPDAPTPERSWAVTVSDAQGVAFEAHYSKGDEDLWFIASATSTLWGIKCGVEGILPVTPFAHTETQFLPEMANRALTRDAIHGVTPDLLTGLDAEVWGEGSSPSGDLSVAARIGPITVRRLASSKDGPMDSSAISSEQDVRLSVTWPEAGTPGARPFDGKKGAGQPWLWTRQGTVPTLQIMPLAVTGANTSRPSATRELAPLRLDADASRVMTLKFDGVFDTAKGHVDLALETSQTFTRPGTQTLPWDGENGMTVLTLPSVTLFPGDGQKRSVSTEVAGWNGALQPSEALNIDIRHDIALTDEGSALATLPPPPPSEDETNYNNGATERTEEPARPALTFSPLGYNAPGTEVEPGQPTSWLAVWADRDRSLAHTATLNRRMIRTEADQSLLTGHVAHHEAPVTVSVALVPELTATSAEFGPELANIGTMSINGSPHRGLPAVSDLMGLSGDFSDVQGQVHTLRRSTLEAEGTATQGPLDQTGLQSGGAFHNATQDLLLNQVDIKSLDGDTTIWRGTLGRRVDLKVGDATALRFHCRDVPFAAKDGGWIADLSDAWFDGQTGFDAAADALSPAQTHRHGFGWSLDQDGVEGGKVQLGPLRFDPLALIEATLSGPPSATSFLETVKIKGLVSLSLPPLGATEDDAEERSTLSRSAAELTLTFTGGAEAWSLTVTDLDLPLDDLEQPESVDPSGPPVPRLRAKRLTYGSDHRSSVTDAHLGLGLGGRNIQLPLSVLKASAAALEFSDDTLPAPKGDGETLTAFGAARVVLSVPTDGPMRPNSSFVALVEMGRRKEGRLVAQTRLDAIDLSFATALAGENLEATLELGEMKVVLPLRGFGLTEQDLRLDIGQVKDGEAAGVLLGAFEIDGANIDGAVLASLARPIPGHADPRTEIEITAFSIATRIVGKNGENTLRLYLDTTRPQSPLIVSGELALQNHLRAPGLDVSVAGPTLTAQVNGDLLTHTIEAIVDPTPIDVGALTEGKLHLPARTTNTLANDTKSLTWAAHQCVTIWNAPKLAEFLHLGMGGDRGIALRPADSDKVSGQVWQHVARAPDAMPLGLSHSQIDILAETCAVLDKTAVIDFAAHHFIGDPAGASPPPTYVPVPGLAFLHQGTPDAECWDAITAAFNPSVADGAVFVRPNVSPLPPLEGTVIQAFATRLSRALRSAQNGVSSVAGDLLSLDAERLHLAFFLGQTAHQIDGGEQTYSDQIHPWADSALIQTKALLDWEESDVGQGFTLAPSGWTDDDLVQADLVDEAQAYKSITTFESYSLAWSRIGKPNAALIPAPNTGQLPAAIRKHQGAPETKPAQTLRLFTASRDGGAMVEIASLAVPDGAGITAPESPATKWAATTLARLAPYSASGLLVQSAQSFGSPEVVAAQNIQNPDAPTPRNVATRAPSRTPLRPQGQRAAATPHDRIARVEGLLEGYQPVRSAAPVLTSEAGDLPLAGQTEVRLTASAVETGYQLVRSDARVIETERHALNGWWITDRGTVAMRPFESVDTLADADDTTERQRLTFALPPELNTVPPAAMQPATTGAFVAPQGDASYTQMLPAALSTRMVGVRSGILATQRVGIEASFDNITETAPSSQAVIGQRLPRPVELGVNDRPRASGFESEHVALSRYPEAIVHGPADQIDRRELAGVGGLDRFPRARFACLLRLSDPQLGLLDETWNGAIALDMVDVFGDIPEPTPAAPLWNVTDAYLRFGPDLLRMRGIGDAGLPLNESLTLSDFVREDNVPAALAIRDLPDATEIRLIVVLEHQGLQRLAVFTLYKTGAQVPLVDPPVYLRFDDPTYNDRLTGIPRLVRIALPNSNSELILIAERREVLAQDYVSTALYVQSLVPGEVPDATIKATDGGPVLELGGTSYLLGIALERTRPNSERAAKIGVPDPGNEGTVFPPGIIASRDGGSTASIPLQLFAYVSDLQDGAALQDADQVVLRVSAKADKESPDVVSLQIRFDITDRPDLPPNPSGYAVLRLDSVTKEDGLAVSEVSAPAYARGPAPDLVELVDPAEMQLGLVRRRAIYYWSTFEAKPSAPKPGGAAQDAFIVNRPRYALMKSGAQGASWLEPNIAQGWQLADPAEVPPVSADDLVTDPNDNSLDAVPEGSEN